MAIVAVIVTQFFWAVLLHLLDLIVGRAALALELAAPSLLSV